VGRAEDRKFGERRRREKKAEDERKGKRTENWREGFSVPVQLLERLNGVV
jgi:hypothetical protein